MKNMELDSHSDMKWLHLNELPDNLTLTAEKAIKYLKRYKFTSENYPIMIDNINY